MLAVTDTGTGMDARRDASAPSSPSSPPSRSGKGTGLGLATVYGIVKQSGGYDLGRQRAGAGTTFTIYLPRNETPVLTSRQPSQSATSGGDETILVVEDEPLVRELIEKMLSSRGYTVLRPPTRRKHYG